MNRKQLIAVVALLAMMLCLPINAAKTYWGYCNGVDPVAFGTKNTGKCAIYIPADVAQVYKGFTVSAVKYGLAAQASNVEVFITKDLNADPIVTKKAAVSNVYKGWNEVALTTPYEIDGEGFYIGYSYSGSAVSMGVTSTFSENACWADLGDGWKNYTTEMGETAKALAIQARITGDNLPLDLMLYTEQKDIAVQKGEPCKFDFSVKNLSAVLVRNLQVGYSIDGGEETVGDFSTTMGANVEKEFSFAYDGFDKVGVHTLKYRLIEVDGEKDAYPGNDEAVVNLKVVDEVPLQRVVVEEGTGTWCGYCPMGIVGLEKMYENYSDQFIGIALHQYNQKDPMFIADYTLNFHGAPSCYVNRGNTEMDPYSSAPIVVAEELKQIPLLNVSVSGTYNSDSTEVDVTASIESLTSGGDYEVAYMLIADGLTGTGPTWKQTNSYSGMHDYIDEEDLMFLADEPTQMDQVYNDVLIASSYKNFVNQATFDDLVENGITEGNYTITMPTKDKLVKALDYKQIYVVAIVIDNDTDEIVNAGKSLVNGNTTGISSINHNNNVAIEACYAADGTKLSAPQKGINILKMSDGTTRKVMVK